MCHTQRRHCMPVPLDDGICSLHLRPHRDGIRLALRRRLGVWPERKRPLATADCRRAGGRPPPANPGRRRCLGRTGVANLNCAPAVAFAVAPAILPQHIAMHPFALPAGACFCLARCVRPSRQWLHTPAPGTQTGSRPPGTEPQERSAIPDTAAPKRRPACASPPFALHV
jgi:hypothetical protein